MLLKSPCFLCALCASVVSLNAPYIQLSKLNHY